MQKHQYQAYAAATQTVARTRQIVMLYDGAIRLVQQAQSAIRDKRIEDRYHLLCRANDILMGLQSCLDFEQGAEVASVLHHFYAGLIGQIFSIHRTNNIQTCEEVTASLKQMRDVWHEIDRNATANASSSGEGAPPMAPPPAVADEGLSLSA